MTRLGSLTAPRSQGVALDYHVGTPSGRKKGRVADPIVAPLVIHVATYEANEPTDTGF